MENRFQYIFLTLFSFLLLAGVSVQANSQVTVESEFLEVGAGIGLINIEDFPSEFTLGANLTFRASEDFFLQLNVMQASDVDFTAVEESQGRTFEPGERDFLHYDLLVGYNIFQGEFFTGDSTANLSTLYFVAGIGETEFGGENSFTYTIGLGYRVALQRRYIVSLDLRDYTYNSTPIAEGARIHNIHTALGLSYLF